MHRSHRFTCCLPLLLLLLVPLVMPGREAAAQTGDRIVNIAMEDQFKKRRETGSFRGDVVVMVYAERKGAEAAHELGRRLHLIYHPTAAQAPAAEWSRQPVIGLPGWPPQVRVPDVHVVPVACMPEVPRPLEHVARARLRTDSPHVSVWLDFEGLMERTFGISPAEPNVVVIDTQGRTHGVQRGHLDELELRALCATIDQVRMQARPDLRTATAPGTAPMRR